MARNLLIVVRVIVFVAITWSICFLMDNKLVLFFFEIFIVYIPSQYLEVDVDGNSANDFVVECLSFNKK